MNLSNDFLRAAGIFFLRTLLGLVFLMQGFGKVFNWGVDGVYQNAFSGFEETWIPELLLKATAYFTSYAELLGGLLLVLGLFRHGTYLLLATVLLVVAYGHGLESAIWDLHHVFFRGTLLASLFLLPQKWDKWHLDGVIPRRV